MEKKYTYKTMRFSDYSSKIDKFSYSVMIYRNENDGLYYVLERNEPFTPFINHGSYKTLQNASKKISRIHNKYRNWYFYTYDCTKNEILNRKLSFSVNGLVSFL